MLLVLLAHAQALAQSVATGDFDHDGALDIALGLEGDCGAIEVWLSSTDSTLEVPRHVTSDVIATLGDGLLVTPDVCDAEFGKQLFTEPVDSRDVLATRSDRTGVASIQILFDAADGDIEVTFDDIMIPTPPPPP